MPGNGYPMRLFLPGWEGNMNTKYLRRIKVTDAPAMTYHEAHTYTDPVPNGKSFQFYFVQEVKSFITSPSPGVGPQAGHAREVPQLRRAADEYAATEAAAEGIPDRRRIAGPRIVARRND